MSRSCIIRILLSTLFVLLTSCGAPQEKPIATTPKTVEVSPKPRPRLYPWHSFYGGVPPKAEISAEEAQIIKELAKSQGGRICGHLDSRLVVAARAHASELGDSPNAHDVPHIDRLRFHLHRLGSIDYAIEPYVARLDKSGQDSLQSFINERSRSWSHCGLGMAEGIAGRIAVFIGLKRVVDIAPLPVRVRSGQTLKLNGALLINPDASLQALIGRPDATVSIANIKKKYHGSFSASFAITEPGQYELEILADTGLGGETVALLPVYADVDPPPRPIVNVDDPFDHDQIDPAVHLYALLNAKRAQAGLAKLERNEDLEREARLHSEDMASQHYFGHISPIRGSLARRLKKSKIKAQKASENIARSYTIMRIHHNLLKSPSHRLNALDPEMTHVGIGVGLDDDILIATQLFARW